MYDNCNLCLVGDCNARTADASDYLIFDKEICIEAGLESNSNDFMLSAEQLQELNIPLYRANKDIKSDQKGELLIDLCKSSGLMIVNGRVGRDKGVGNTTCSKVTKKGVSKSNIDYAIASTMLFHQITDFYVDIFDVNLSDCHSPISITLNSVSGAQGEIDVLSQNPTLDHDGASHEAQGNTPEKKLLNGIPRSKLLSKAPLMRSRLII